jgi:hypothetical protein
MNIIPEGLEPWHDEPLPPRRTPWTTIALCIVLAVIIASLFVSAALGAPEPAKNVTHVEKMKFPRKLYYDRILPEKDFPAAWIEFTPKAPVKKKKGG